MSKSRTIGLRLGVVACVAGFGLGSIGASAATAATSSAGRPAAATAAYAPAVPKGYRIYDSRIPTIQACVEEGENLRAQGIISAWECIAGSGGFTLWGLPVAGCPGVVGGSAARIAGVEVRPTAC